MRLRILLPFLALVSSVLSLPGLAETTPSSQDPASEPTSAGKQAPVWVQTLKKQADERKAFYTEQSTARASLKERHSAERQELLKRHRDDRTKFGEGKHSVDERKVFFNFQRKEMSDLTQRHRDERKAMIGELHKKRAEFHEKLRKEKATAKAPKQD